MKVDFRVALSLTLIQLFFGINFVCSKIIVNELDPLLWTSLRFLSSGLILFIFFKIKGISAPATVEKGDRTKIAVLSFLGMGTGQLLIMYSLLFTNAVNVALITSTIPVWVFALLALASMETMRANKIIGLVVCALGFVYMKDFSGVRLAGDSIIGDLIALAGVLMVSSYIAFLKPLAMRYNHFWLSWTGFLWCGLTLLPFAMIFSEWKIEGPASAPTLALNIGFSIIFGTVLTYLMNSWVLKKVDSSFTALFVYLQPVAAAVLSYFIYGTVIDSRMAVSSIIIFAGIVISTRKLERSKS